MDILSLYTSLIYLKDIFRTVIGVYKTDRETTNKKLTFDFSVLAT